MSWTTASLGDVTTIISGTTPDSSNPRCWNGDLVWITPTDLGKLNERVIHTSARLITEEGRATCNLTKIPVGAVIMSSRAPIGHLAIAGCDLFTNQGCKSFVCSSCLDPEFIYFTFKHRMPDIQALGSGATFVEVSKSALEAFRISFPTLDEQRRIAAHLKNQLAEVETARQAVQLQAQDITLLRARLLNEMFASIDDAPRKMLGDHAPTTSGSTPPRGNWRYWQPGEIPWVKTSGVAFAPITATEESVSRLALVECSLTLLPTKTVLVAMYGQGKTRGQSAILEIEATTNQACFAILPNETWEPEFLHFWFMANYQELRKLSDDRGGNQANLNGALLNALTIPAPDRAQQQESVRQIQAALQEIDTLTSANDSMLDDLNKLPQKILTQAFNHPSKGI